MHFVITKYCKSRYDFRSGQSRTFHTKNLNHSSSPLISILNHETSTQQDEISNSSSSENTIYLSLQPEENQRKISKPVKPAWTNFTESHQINNNSFSPQIRIISKSNQIN